MTYVAKMRLQYGLLFAAVHPYLPDSRQESALRVDQRTISAE